MLLDILYSSSVKTILSIVVIPALVLIITLGLVYILALLTSGRPDIENREVFKYRRYESGNPAKGEARRAVSMQYFGYLVLFLAVEPAVILFALTLLASHDIRARILSIYIILLAVFIPLLIYGIRESRRIESWILD